MHGIYWTAGIIIMWVALLVFVVAANRCNSATGNLSSYPPARQLNARGRQLGLL